MYLEKIRRQKAVYEMLLNQDEPMRADTIVSRLRMKGLGVHRGTVEKDMKFFREEFDIPVTSGYHGYDMTTDVPFLEQLKSIL